MSEYGGERVRATSVASGVVEVEMSGPPGNPLDLDLVDGLARVLEALAADPACRVVLLVASGEHFCAGATGKLGGRAADWSTADLYARVPRIAAFPKPMIAVMRGAAVGGGLGLSLLADFRYAAEGARFQANFTMLGYSPGFGLTLTLPRLVGRQAALDLLMSGRRVHAAEARGMSLCDAVVPDDRLGAAALERASALAEAAPLGVQAVKSALRPELDAELAATLAAELEHQTRLKGTADFAEGMRAARDRSRPVFSGR